METFFSRLRALSAPLLTTFLMVVGAGFLFTCVSLHLEREGASTLWIGLIQASYFLGLFFGAMTIDKAIHRVGHAYTLAIFAGISALAVVSQGVWSFLWLWLIIRTLSGLGFAAVYVVVESWIAELTPVSERGKALSLYMIILSTALIVGQLLTQVVPLVGLVPFVFVASCFGSATLPMLFHPKAPSSFAKEMLEKRSAILRSMVKGALLCMLAGVFSGALYAFGPIYAQGSKLLPGLFMAAGLLGSLLFQWPLGHLSDLVGRRRMLLIIASFLVLPALALAFFPFGALLWLSYPLIFFLGGCGYSLYPLAVNLACDPLKEKDIPSAIGLIVVSYAVGAILGPLSVPPLTIWLGSSSLFVVMAFLGLFVIGLTAKEKIPAKEFAKLPIELPPTDPDQK